MRLHNVKTFAIMFGLCLGAYEIFHEIDGHPSIVGNDFCRKHHPRRARTTLVAAHGQLDHAALAQWSIRSSGCALGLELRTRRCAEWYECVVVQHG